MILHDITTRLQPRYSPGEARAVAFALLEDVFGVTRTDVYADKVRKFSEEETALLDSILQRIAGGMPMQYATGVARFCDSLYLVTPDTLIPRPETEELVAWATEVARTMDDGTDRRTRRLLDGGTGSGCIAIALAERLGQRWQAEAWDISDDALLVARRNARRHDVRVDFRRRDLLTAARQCDEEFVQNHRLPEPFDLIVSNPPYVRESERADMEAQVLDYEPERALFVPDNDALRFYRALVALVRRQLTPGGWMLAEVNRALADDVAELWRDSGLCDVEIRHDASGNPRMVGGRSVADSSSFLHCHRSA